MRREIDEVATGATFDYCQAFECLVGLGREMANVARILDSLGRNIDAENTVNNLNSALDHIDWLRRDYALKYPAMFRIGQCRDLYVMLCVRVEHCREVLDVVKGFPPQTLSTAAFDALPGYMPVPEDKCSVCCDAESGDWVKLPCGHAFHRQCAKLWLTERQRTCPLCRKEVK